MYGLLNTEHEMKGTWAIFLTWFHYPAQEKGRYEKSPVEVNAVQVPVSHENLVFFTCWKEGMSGWLQQNKSLIYLAVVQTTQKDH